MNTTYTPEGMGSSLGQFLINRISNSSLVNGEPSCHRKHELVIQCNGTLSAKELLELLRTFFRAQGLDGPGLRDVGPTFVLYDPSGKELDLLVSNFTDPPGMKMIYFTWS